MRKRCGFTLIELLVVIGIIVALAAILLPALHRAYLVAERSAMASDLQVIANALDAYRNDFGDYPRPGSTITAPNVNEGQPMTIGGPVILCWALVAPGPASQDGADGPGFRLRGTTGRICGPYLPPDRFVIGTEDGVQGDIAGVVPYSVKTQPISDYFAVLADRRGRVILYLPASRGAHPSTIPGSYVASQGRPADVTPMWNSGDADPSGILLSPYILRNLLGAARDGSVPPGATPITAPYLLISAGTSDPVSQSQPAKAQSQNAGVPNPFGQTDNVANVPLSPLLPIADYNKS